MSPRTSPPAAHDPTPWHALHRDDVASRLGTAARHGLTGDEARRRLEAHGPNGLPETAERSRWSILAGQFTSPMVGVLFAGGALSLALGEVADAIAIFAVLLLNGGLGYAQEQGAERALSALRRLGAGRATVRRDGRADIVDASSLVPGDVVLIEAGDRVPAAARVVTCTSIQTVEAALTGESAFVEKDADAALSPSTEIHARTTMAYAGTTVAAGVGEAIVVTTGRHTELGRVAALVGGVEREQTPLQRELATLGRRLVGVSGVAVALVFVAGLLRGHPFAEMLSAAVGLAIAAVPEGLPAVVTIALAIGVRRMAGRNVLIRRLPAVETLGSTNVICVDKTGTLTTGSMTVREIATLDGVVALAGPVADARASAARALHAAAGCTTATLVRGERGHEVRGDPMEGALLLAAEQAGVAADPAPASRTIPFDARRRRMSVVRDEDGRPVLYVKGAPESVLPVCTTALLGAAVIPIDADVRARLETLNLELAERGSRVLATASRPLASNVGSESDSERDLTFLGFIGLMDPPRIDTVPAVAECRRAGIRTVMITGDQAGTALAVARELGIAEAPHEVTSGAVVASLSDDELTGLSARINVYARTSPAEKLRIVRALQRTGAVVAMTGDGVNDAAALKGADIGVAMGSGTDAAKDVASMVVTDDRFASIVVAVGEGRTVHENIRKCLLYVMSGNFGELFAIVTAIVFAWPLPLLAVQLLWINLVTDSLPMLALATDPGERDLALRRMPSRGRGVADRELFLEVLSIGLVVAVSALAAYRIGLAAGTIEHARTMAFSTLVVSQALLAFVTRSRTRLIWEIGLASNLRLLVVGIATLAVQLAVLTQPGLGAFLGVVPLRLVDLVIVGALGALPATWIEVGKLLARAFPRRGRVGASAGG
jgi:Ca2+-transporting ATPase